MMIPRSWFALLSTVVLVSFLAAGCAARRNAEAQQASDYRVDSLYQLKVPAFIMADNGLVMTVEEGRARGITDIEAILEPGTFFIVRQIVPVKDPNEPRTEIFAVISSGPKRGRVVNLRTASLADRGPRGYTRLNTEVLRPMLGN
jgi:hypothetical protein